MEHIFEMLHGRFDIVLPGMHASPLRKVSTSLLIRGQVPYPFRQGRRIARGHEALLTGTGENGPVPVVCRRDDRQSRGQRLDDDDAETLAVGGRRDKEIRSLHELRQCVVGRGGHEFDQIPPETFARFVDLAFEFTGTRDGEVKGPRLARGRGAFDQFRERLEERQDAFSRLQAADEK